MKEEDEEKSGEESVIGESLHGKRAIPSSEWSWDMSVDERWFQCQLLAEIYAELVTFLTHSY